MNTLCTNVFFLISTIICCSAQAARQLYEGDVCAPDGSRCENLKNCTILHDEVNKGKKPHLCGFNDKEVIVCCCPELLYKFSDVNSSISVDACKWYEDEACPSNAPTTATSVAPSRLAAEVAPSSLEEKLPFAALIGYGMKSMITWQCGGVLISRKYILSPAHCSNRKGAAKWVGFYNDNLSNISNIYTISVIFNHPEYHPPVQYNDIALYRLDRIVQFNSLVRPICLPQVYADYDYYPNLIGAGWVTRNKKPQAISNLLRVIPSGLCAFAGSAKEIPNGTDGEDILCINGYDGGHTSRCTKNFFGGPFFTTDLEKCDSGVLLGFLSIGKLCNDKDFTGIYTNITYFRPWIESVVWPENSTYSEIVWNR